MPKRPYPAGGSGSQVDSGSPSSSHQPVYANDGDGGDAKVEHVINLDSHELFSQFCTTANLVKIGPRRGVFLSVVNVEEKVMRVWREWLDARAQESREEEGRRNEGLPLQQEEIAATNLDSTAGGMNVRSSPTILWTDHKRNVGLRVTVKDRNSHTTAGDAPILAPADEEQPVSYSVEINGTSIPIFHTHPYLKHPYQNPHISLFLPIATSCRIRHPPNPVQSKTSKLSKLITCPHGL